MALGGDPQAGSAIVAEEPLLRHNLPWSPWGSNTYPPTPHPSCPPASLKVGQKGEMKAGPGPGQVTGCVDS